MLAAFAVAITARGHAATGERVTLVELASCSPGISMQVRIAWHLVTILLLATAASLGLLAVRQLDGGGVLTVRVLAVGLVLGARAAIVRSRGRNPGGYLLAFAAAASLFGEIAAR